jgi:hypothetical protein
MTAEFKAQMRKLEFIDEDLLIILPNAFEIVPDRIQNQLRVAFSAQLKDLTMELMFQREDSLGRSERIENVNLLRISAHISHNKKFGFQVKVHSNPV